MSSFKQVIGEIHRRSLWQVLLIYLGASWGVLEAVDSLVQRLTLPSWIYGLAFVLLLVGLPLVLATAFVQEGSPLREPAEDESAPAEVEPGARSGPSVGEEPARRGLPRLLTWRHALAGGVLALAVWGVLAAGWVLVHGTPVGQSESSSSLFAAEPTGPVVAVLPFANLSPDEENAYFADGIHEDILTQLSKVGGLTVLARTSVLRYRDTEESVRQIGSELGADAVLEGSVRRAGDQIRISTQLIDPKTQTPLWAENYDRTLDDVFAVQSEIASQVARSLEATLSPEEKQKIEKRSTGSPDAYALYLRGREALESAEGKEDYKEAIRLFRKALELDPEYARAWAGLARALAFRGVYESQKGRAGGGGADSALRAARRAIELDPELADGQVALGDVYYAQDRIHQALDAWLEALERDPNHWRALNNAALSYMNFGRFDQAIRLLRRAARLAPNQVGIRTTLAHHYKFLRLDEQAKEWMRGALVLDPEDVTARLLQPQFAVYEGDTARALALTKKIVADAPDDPWAWTGAAGIAYVLERYDQAAERAREALRLVPDYGGGYWHNAATLLGLSLLESGHRTEGRRVLADRMERVERRIDEGEENWQSAWDLAAAHAALGEPDEAVKWLERAYDFGFRFVRWPYVDPAFDGLRDDPRFQKWVSRLEADAKEMRERVIREDRAAGAR